jgi:uncharacterized protein
MSRVIFDPQAAPAPQVNRTRADVACCVGLMRRWAGASVSAAAAQWLQYLGFPAAQIASLTNVPIPIESYATFTALFDDGSSDNALGTDYAATAVRSFFAQGGKKCYVVRVDDPVSDADSAAGKANKLAELLGSLLPAPGSLPDGPTAWTGVGALGALEEVSLLLLPDLPALCASAPVGAVGQTPVVPLGPQEFTVCSPGPVVPRQQVTFSAPAPRLAAGDYATWANVVAAVLNYLAGGILRHQLHLREIQFVAAFPLPQDLDAAQAAENPSSGEIAQDIHDVIGAYLPEQVLPGNGVLTLTPLQVPAYSPLNISSAFLQLGYPWLKTSGSNLLLEQLEPPDGALAGLIARNALTRGSFTSATKIVPAEIYEVVPALPAQEIKSSATPLVWGNASAPKALIERLSLFGMTPAGLRLLSDVTAYPGETYRSAAVTRLVSVICRAARVMGESALFQSNGPALWGKVQRFLQNLMTRLWMLNALDGATVQDAFSVRCDESTMTQNDLDTGNLIALVTFTAAATLETLHVQMAVETGGTSVQEIAANISSAASSLSNSAGSGMAGMN